MGQRRKLLTRIDKIATDGSTWDGTGSGLTAKFLRTGVYLSGGATIAPSATQTVAVTNPARVKSGDIFYQVSSGTITTTQLTLTTDPTYSAGAWTLSLRNDGASSVTLAAGDRLALDPTITGHKVSYWVTDTSGSSSAADYTIGADGSIDLYFEEKDIDIYVSGTGVTSKFYMDIPTEGKRNEVSIAEYGVVGDGTTDDLLAIQTAVNYVGGVLGGGDVTFPLGTFYVSAPIVMDNDDVTLRGMGTGTIIKSHSTSGSSCLSIGDGGAVDGVVIRDLTFHGQTTSELASAMIGIKVSNTSTNISILDCNISGVNASSGFNIGIKLIDTNGFIIRGNYISHIIGTSSGYGYGVWTDASSTGCENGSITGNVSTFSATQGRHHFWFGDGTRFSKINGNTCNAGVNEQIVVYGVSPDRTLVGNSVSNNSLHDMANPGSNLGAIMVGDRATGTVVSGNHIYVPARSGIRVTPAGGVGTASGTTITGNVLNAGGSSAPDSGIYIVASTTNTVIAGNTILGWTGNGIYVEDADYTTITGNFVSATSQGISFLGNGGTITGNSISGCGANGIDLNAAANEVIISGNYIENNTSAGISMSGSADRVVVTSNIVLNNTASQISGTPTNLEIGHNIVS